MSLGLFKKFEKFLIFVGGWAEWGVKLVSRNVNVKNIMIREC
jgi:hypothetical protein